MASSGGRSVPPSPTVASAPTGKKKNKKKKGGAANKPNGDAGTNGTSADHEDEQPPSPGPDADEGDALKAETGHTDVEASAAADGKDVPAADDLASGTQPTSPKKVRSRAGSKVDSAMADANGGDASARLESLAQERTALRDEVASLRRGLEEIQEKHDRELRDVQTKHDGELGDIKSMHEGELSKVRKELEETWNSTTDHDGELSRLRTELETTQSDKAKAEANYSSLRDRVGTIRSQLGQRLKEDAEELTQCRARIEELEAQTASLAEQRDARGDEVAELGRQMETQTNELATLRSRSNLSSQNWTREKEELREREAAVRAEFDSAKQAMQDWEILAMEERQHRESFAERVAELEEEVTGHREAREKLENERTSQSQTVDGLQKALQELQEARKTELREVVENSQTQLADLRKELEAAQAIATEATAAKDDTRAELARLQPLEAEVKEKNLIIQKLRHQAVGLNEHLTKALRQLKKGKPEDNVDRELVTNHFLHFITLERSDPKKFQILQIISSLLNWTDEQREAAGLARPGASNPSLRTPISPWNRTPSTPSLASDFALAEHGRTDSVGGAFAEFLEKESEDGAASGTGSGTGGSGTGGAEHSRSTSASEAKR